MIRDAWICPDYDRYEFFEPSICQIVLNTTKLNEYLISVQDAKGLEDYPTKKVLDDLQKERKHRQLDKKQKWIQTQNPFDIEEEKDNSIKYKLS